MIIRSLRAPLAVLASMVVAIAVPGLAAGTPAEHAAEQAVESAETTAVEEHTTTLRYGPLPLPPYLGGHEHGDGEGHPLHAGHGGGHGGQSVTFVAPTYDLPCHDCYVTGLQPDLVYADGSKVDYDTGAMLHHMVLFDPSRPDPTCGRDGVGLLTGQRVFAAGNERTGAHLPPGYGYHLTGPLGALAELMNMSPEPQQVYMTMTVTWVDAADAQLKPVTPLWLDVDNCGDSQYSIPAGPSHTTAEWTSTVSGDIVAVGGHVHDNGISVTLINGTRDEVICESVAGYQHYGHHGHHVASMSTCVGDPVATVDRGDELMVDSYYDSPMPDDTVMGIMLVYLHETEH